MKSSKLSADIGIAAKVGMTTVRVEPDMTKRPRLLFVLLFLIASPTSLRAAEAPRPNIVYIIADDLGWADVAFHGGNAPTPHLDQLAREGLELTSHYVAPVCSPTRTGLLTGRYWSRFGITTPTNTRALLWETVTLAGAIKSVGYETCLVGKWHLGSLPEWGPNKYGFDHAYGSLAGGVSPWNHRYKKGPYSVTWHRNGELIEDSGHVNDLLTAEAVEWIESRDDKPFFLYVPYTAIHLPLKEPKEWLNRVPESITGEVARHYAASVMHLDDGVGQLIAALEKKGIRDETLLVFTSDNGGSTAENNDLKYPDDNCPNGRLTGNNEPFRGKKGDVYEGGIRVPTLISWPGKIKAGKLDDPVHVVDWMPTFCALAGFEADEDLKWDGMNISERLLGGSEALPVRPLYVAGPSWRASALREGNWKLVVKGKGEQASVELFDLVEDPSETKNLADEQPGRVREMRQTLAKITVKDRDAMIRNGD